MTLLRTIVGALLLLGGGWALAVRPPGDQPAGAYILSPASDLMSTSSTVSFLGDTDRGSSATWRFGDGATATGFQVSHTYAAPGTYSVLLIVTGEGATASTAGRTITVMQAPSILSNPSSVTVNPGGSATFSASAGGLPVPSYQWYRSGSAIPGATAASYTLSGVTEQDDGAQFQVLASSALGTASSASATLAVNHPVRIVSDLQDQQVELNGTAWFRVVVSGTGPFQYEWKHGTTVLDYAEGPEYAVVGTRVNAGFTYRVTVSNAVNSVTSTVATLTVKNRINISVQPASQTVNQGGTVTFSVTASGFPDPSYQWSKNGARVGSDQNTYTLASASEDDQGARVQVVVSNSSGSVTSSTAMVTVNIPPSFYSQPQSLTVNKGEGRAATFTAGAMGYPAPTYQWQRNEVDIPGATAAAYTTAAVQESDNGSRYRVILNNVMGSVVSNTASLNVQFAPVLQTQLADQTVDVNHPATLTFLATSNPEATYRWYRNGVDLQVGSSSYTIPAAQAGDHGATFQAVASNGALGSLSSRIATLLVNQPAAIVTQPVDRSVSVGDAAVFSVTASGYPLTYAWYQGGTAVGTGPNFSLASVAASDDGRQYQVVVASPLGSVHSQWVTLRAYPLPSISGMSLAPASFTVGMEGQVLCTFSGSGGWLSWTDAGQPHSMAVSSGVAAPVVLSGMSNLTLTVVNAVGRSVTRVINIPVVPPASIQALNVSATRINPGEMVAFTAEFQGGTGILEPGHLTMVPQTALNVSPPLGITRYTLTVSNGFGSIATRSVDVQAGAVARWVKDIVYLGSREVGEVDASGFHAIQTDHLGSPRFMVGPSGAVEAEERYTPFGVMYDHSGSLKTAKGFTGHEQTDASGMIYAQARFYLPMWGRFASPDPARDQHFEETQSWNIYSYCQNNPVMKIDPTGMVMGDPESFGMQVSQTMLGYLEGLATSLPFVGDRIAESLPQDIPEHQQVGRQIGGATGTATQLVTGAAELKAAATGLKGIQVAQMVTTTGEVVTVVNGGAQVASQAATGGALVASAMSGNGHGGGKNAQHANQDARASAKSQYEQAKAEHETAKAKTNKTPADKKAQEEAKRKMDHLKRKMDETGENHSRRDKR